MSGDIELIYELSELVREKLNRLPGDIDDELATTVIQKEILLDPRTKDLSLPEKREITEGVFSSLRRELDFLEKYLEDPDISEIMVNGPDHIFVEKNGMVYEIPEYFPSVKALTEVIQRIASRIHRQVNEMHPILDARLADGSRVHATYSNISLGRPTLNIRRFPEKRITMQQLIEKGSMTEEAAEFLKRLVRAGYNCFISGDNRIIGLSQLTFRKQRVQAT